MELAADPLGTEQKRREAIRAGFDRLCDLVPGLEGQGRSEGIVLKRTVAYIREELAKRRDLVLAAEARGEHVPDELREYAYPESARLSGMNLTRISQAVSDS